jgi:hypothetical protein
MKLLAKGRKAPTEQASERTAGKGTGLGLTTVSSRRGEGGIGKSGVFAGLAVGVTCLVCFVPPVAALLAGGAGFALVLAVEWWWLAAAVAALVAIVLAYRLTLSAIRQPVRSSGCRCGLTNSTAPATPPTLLREPTPAPSVHIPCRLNQAEKRTFQG